MKNDKTKLTACFKKIKHISVPQLLEMHKVFVQYYHNADLHNFVTDMGKKTGVIILQEKSSDKIVGFSTWTELEIMKDGERSIGIFSGDTVVKKEFWGNKALQKTFVKQLLKTKIKNPKTSVFWLLISKGYKTYLLLTNNFPKHYPSHKKNNIKLESIVDEYCEQLYPSAYNKEDRLLNFGNDYQYLKDDVAEITTDMTDDNPKIRHFTKLNPSWQQGTELPCVGEVSIHMMWNFMRKNMLSLKKKRSVVKHSTVKVIAETNTDTEKKEELMMEPHNANNTRSHKPRPTPDILSTFKKGEDKFIIACRNIESTQKILLSHIIANIVGSENGIRHNLFSNSSLQDFQNQVPITDYDYWSAQIEQQQTEQINLLTNNDCTRYQPTSGSTSKIKWIPYTKPFLEELDNAIAPWLADMYRNYPKIKNGKHYWSLSWVPSDLRNKLTASINNDLQLLPWWKQVFMTGTMAVPESISLAESSDESFFATACYLLACSDLSFISVWSPTFALSLLEFIQLHKNDITQVLASGEWPSKYSGLEKIETPKNVASSKILYEWDGKIDAKFTASIWPKLALISAWDTSSSKIWADKLRRIFPHSEFQGKGLWATEGVTSIPYRNQFPLAVTSHFYEFEELSSQKIMLSWQLTEGMCVRPIISSANGLLRYAMKDQLKVTGFIDRCPCFEFIGRIDGTDMVGEKLSPETAVQLLNDFNLEEGITPITLIAMPANKQQYKPYYVLLCENDSDLTEDCLIAREDQLAQSLEKMLSQHFHYQLARELGQLDPARVSIKQDALALYAHHKVEQGMVKGNIKVEPLILWQNQNFLMNKGLDNSQDAKNNESQTKTGEPA